MGTARTLPILPRAMPAADRTAILPAVHGLRKKLPACLTSLSSSPRPTAKTIKFGCFKILYIPQKNRII